MFSVNVPLSAALDRLAADLQPKLSGFNRRRERHTLVCKRVGADDLGLAGGSRRDARDGQFRSDAPDDGSRTDALDRLREILGPAIDDIDPFRVAVSDIDVFGRGTDDPIAYLAVESPGLVRVHRRLCSVFDPVDGIEGDDYVPHVTLARGGDPDRTTLDRLLESDIEPRRWRVHALDLYDAEFREVAGTARI